MRPLPTAITAATAAALTALAVTVTVPAIGDDTSSSKSGPVPGKTDQPDPATIRACLKDHGATAPDGDGRALKMWIIGPHTASAKEAVHACGMEPDKMIAREIPGPDEATLRACLKDHDVTVPDGDGRVLKTWLAGDHAAAEKDAMKACGMPSDIKQSGGPVVGPCGPKDAGEPSPSPGRRQAAGA